MRRQSEHTFGQDVSHDLVGATGDREPRRRRGHVGPGVLAAHLGIPRDRARPDQLHRQCRGLFGQPCPGQFRDRSLRSGLCAGEQRFGDPHPQELDDALGRDDRRDLVAQNDLIEPATLRRLTDEHRRREAIAPGRAGADRHPLVHQRGDRGAPPFTGHPQNGARGEPAIGEEHLVELRRARHLHQTADLHPGRRHVHDEHRHAGMSLAVGVGSGQEQPERGVVRPRRPHLLTIDHPVVAVTLGATGHAREIGPCTGLGEQLAPDLVATKQRRQVAIALRIGPVREQRRRTHPVTDDEHGQRQGVVGDLLVEDHLVAIGQPLPAVLGRPSDGTEPRLVQQREAPAVAGQADVVGRVVVRGASIAVPPPPLGIGVLGQEVPDLGPEIVVGNHGRHRLLILGHLHTRGEATVDHECLAGHPVGLAAHEVPDHAVEIPRRSHPLHRGPGDHLVDRGVGQLGTCGRVVDGTGRDGVHRDAGRSELGGQRVGHLVQGQLGDPVHA